jgi:hypothetical protein
MRVTRVLFLTTFVLGGAMVQPAHADATAFLGLANNPSNRGARGFALGASILIVGFEFEYMNVSEEESSLAPSVRTGMGNVLFQTPTRLQVYATVGAGVYRERLGAIQETNFGLNTGFGVKIPLAGPIRARVDYRAFNFRGTPLHSRSQRFYVGANLAF